MERSRQSNKMRALATGLGVSLALISSSSPGLAEAANSSAANSLATPITGRQAQELWPIEVGVEIVRVRGDKAIAGPESRRAVPLPHQVVVVPDGHHLKFSAVVDTNKGRRRFELGVVPRHHPTTIELEWDLEVRHASFSKIGVGDYLLHRLRLGQRLEHDEEQLKIARADIVTMPTDGLKERVELDGDVYEIRVFAQTTRG